MAKTGSIGITLNSQSIANNTSSITVKGTITTSGESYRGSHRSGTYTVKQGSTVIYNGIFTSGAPANTTTTLFSKTLTVTHDAVGKSGDISVSYNYDDGWCTASGSAGLPTIPRKSDLTVGNGTLGTAQTLTVTRKSTTFTHTITATCGSASTTICTKSTATSISFTPPLEWAAQNKTGTSVNVKYTITTYNGSTTVGSNEYTKTCTIPASIAPTVSLSVADAMGYLAKYGAYVQGKSKFDIEVEAEGAQGSTIKSYSVSADSKTYTSAIVTTDVIASSGTLTIKVTVTDSRGRTATASQNVTVLAYASPQISAMTVKRCNADGTSNSVGAYLCVTFTASAISLNSKNTAAYVLKYKKKTATTYTSVTLTNYANNYAVTNGTYIFAADTGASYDVVLTLTDAFTSASNTQTGKSAAKLFSWFERGLGWAFGKSAERENALEIAWDIYDKYDTQIRNGVAAYNTAGIDANTTLEHHILTQTNTPSNTFHHVITYFYNDKSADSNRVQIAIPYKTSTPTYHRYKINGEWSKWLNDGLAAYPVGSYYIANHDTSPAELFGGTWRRIESRFLWGSPAGSTLGQTAGEQTHTLTKSEMPSHSHDVYVYYDYSSNTTVPATFGMISSANLNWSSSARSGRHYAGYGFTQSIGSGGAHNNMPPYVTCAIWRREA